MYRAIALLALLPSTFAHFILNYPVSLGFDDDNEGTGPCGGFDITFNATRDSNVTVGGFATTSRTTHPQADWQFRVTTSTSEPYDWTNLVPVIQQYGLGDFCLQNLTLPESYIGQRGIIQVIQSAVDGNLYQCAAVNFVAGTQSILPDGCPSGNQITYSITSDSTLPGNTSSASGTATAATSAARSSGAAIKNVAGMLAALPAGLLLL